MLRGERITCWGRESKSKVGRNAGRREKVTRWRSKHRSKANNVKVKVR